VYNHDNIERVRRDEAEARKREIENEKRNRTNDAEGRLSRLRGEPDAGKLDSSDSIAPSSKRRKVEENDNVDKRIRQTKQDAEPVNGVGMRFVDAAGRGKDNSSPWYSTLSNNGSYASQDVGKDVWGNADPRRQEREKQRVDANDPLAAMKRGVKQLREAESNRKAWMDQRERDLNEVEQLAKKERRRRRKRDNDEDSLEGFDLDAGFHQATENGHKAHHRSGHRSPRRHHHRHHHRRRSRDRSRSPRKDGG
jgi:hypothetical protein